jgi:hypothetical protein
MNLKDLISDVNVNEIYEHIETETLSEWVNAWQKAALSTLTPPNEPLTLEELREMDGVNALWVHNLAWGLHKPRFMLVHSVSEDWWTCCDFDGFETFCADDYGERYLLYRRPPEVSP